MWSGTWVYHLAVLWLQMSPACIMAVPLLQTSRLQALKVTFVHGQVPETQFDHEPPAKRPRNLRSGSQKSGSPGVQSPLTFVGHTHKRDVYGHFYLCTCAHA